MDSLQDTPARVEALSGLSRFRVGLLACFTRRGAALFELADAMLCAQGPVRSPVELSLEPEFRRRHGSVYDALAKGRISSSCLRHLLVGLSAPARAGEPLMFAIDITPHARPDAQYADERTMVQVRGKGGDRWLPGWPYSLLVGIQWGSSSWVDPIEARRLRPGEAHTDVTIDQITGLLKDLAATGKQQPGDPPPLVLLDAGNYATDLTCTLATRPDGRAYAPRRGVLLLRLRQAARTRLRTHHRVRAVRHRDRPRLDGTAPKTRQHRPLGQLAAGQAAADRARHGLASGRRPPARRPQTTQGPVAVARRPRPGRPGPALEGLPAPLRPRALPPLRQVLSRPGQRTPGLGGSHRPVGVLGHGRLCPATPCPPPRRRPAPPLAPTARPGQAPQSLQGPARLPPTPRTNRHTRRLAQTRPPRPRPPERLEEPPETQATPLPQKRTDHQQTRRVTTET